VNTDLVPNKSSKRSTPTDQVSNDGEGTSDESDQEEDVGPGDVEGFEEEDEEEEEKVEANTRSGGIASRVSSSAEGPSTPKSPRASAS